MPPTSLDELLAAPALAPPEGVTPQFDHPPNRNSLAWGVTTACMVIATICLLLRLYARLWREKKIHVEEVLVVCAYGAYWGTAYAAYSLIWTPGYYVHTWDLHNRDLIHPLYLILVYGCCYSAVLPLIKTAILLDWCRMLVPAGKLRNPFWWGCMAVAIVQCVWGLCCIILLNKQCDPHKAIWEFYLPSKCYSLPKVMLASASVQVITDITMVLLPQKVIWSLHMNWQKKLGVSIIFGVGVIACIAACFRLGHTVTFSKDADSMFSIGPLLFWACAEMTCGFFILSVPCLPKLISESSLSRRVKQYLGISAKSSGDNSYGPHSSSHQLSRSKRPSDSYNRIEGSSTGTRMSDFDRSESQEHLHQDYLQDGKNGVQVTRTTDITVTSSPHSSTELGHIIPWIK